jgi:hypothetical protein
VIQRLYALLPRAVRERLPYSIRARYATMNPAQLEALKTALMAGGYQAHVIFGTPLKVESLETTLRNVTYHEIDVEMAFSRYLVGRSFTNKKTGDSYIVARVMKLKALYPFSLRNLPKVIRGERRWVVGIEYTSLEKGGQSFFREKSDFFDKFTST